MKSFQKKVLFLAKKIPRGKVATYGEIARILKTSPRAVGQALHANHCPIKIPCHRVVKSDGSLGGYSGGVRKKLELLKKEGIKIINGKIFNFKKYFKKLT
ncbi:MGMT family protein [Candidatus Falkowbacteria bacterium]|nr:MGMT family protein [Candidatus Falkowbacteria bacterium]